MRNNQRRFGKNNPQPSPAPATAGDLAFAVPTEFVELPSRGKFYPSDHPLHNKETVEIRYMTAKDEDILSSQALLKNGLAIERLLESLLIPEVDSNSLLIGDRSAILIAARISGYGEEYKVDYGCPMCGARSEIDFDLHETTLTGDCFNQEFLEKENITFDESNQTFDVVLPASGVSIGLSLMDGYSEKEFSEVGKQNDDSLVTSMLAFFVVKVNDNFEKNHIQSFIDSMPARDSKFIRDLFPKLTPNIRLLSDFTCSTCFHHKETEVPLTAEFFWPG